MVTDDNPADSATSSKIGVPAERGFEKVEPIIAAMARRRLTNGDPTGRSPPLLRRPTLAELRLFCPDSSRPQLVHIALGDGRVEGERIRRTQTQRSPIATAF